MIKITCPHCNYSKITPLKKIPSGIHWARCPQCGNRFEFQKTQGVEKSEKCRATPWESRLQFGIWKGIRETIISVNFSPKRMFSTMTVRGGLTEPLAFGLLIGALGSMFGFFWKFMTATSGVLEPLRGILTSINSPLFFIILSVLSPLLVTANLFISSFIIHLLLVLVSGSKNGFEATFRVVAYSQAAKIWSVIPFIGGPLGWIWKAVVQIIGLKEAHGITYARIVVAISVPFILVLFLGGTMFFIFFHFLGS